MTTWIPDPRFEMPELFEPGQKPFGDVVINWDHELMRAARYAVYANATKLYFTSRDGSSISADGPLEVRGGYPAVASGSKLKIPALGGDWRTSGTFAFAGYWDGTDYGGGYARFLYESADLITQSSGNWSFKSGFGGCILPRNTGKQSYIVTSTGGYSGTRKVYNDNKLQNTDSGALALSDVDNDLTLFDHGTLDRYTAYGIGLVIVLDRAWSDAEAIAFMFDPYQVLLPA